KPEDKERAEEVARLISSFKPEDKERAEEVARLISSFRAEHSETVAAWREVVTRVKAGKVRVMAPPPPPVVEVPEEVVPEVEAIEEAAPVEPTFQEQLFAFINSHPEGIKLVDIEKSLGVARIKVATGCRKLIEEGKVKREGPLYIPIR
ncbi:MAG: hypothetical protein QMC90_04730, partial [Dehalococcoidales bacterium]|nr:hypothetical protein [Dehalococcoidales bacterium]